MVCGDVRYVKVYFYDGNDKKEIVMDNLIFRKIWQDENLIELKISANCEFVLAYQNCYIHDMILEKISEEIQNYVVNYNSPCYLEFGQKKGNYTQAFSMYLLPLETSGHTKIEVDIEIADNDARSHRCCFYIKSELGLIERLGLSLKGLVTASCGEEIRLNE